MTDERSDGPPDPAGFLAGRDTARAWFAELRDQLCAAFEALERQAGSDARFERTAWRRPTEDGSEGGGGTMAVLRGGAVFEKAGVNVSTVSGRFAPEFAASVPGAATDPRFWAAGVSLVAHPRNPWAPTGHMNTRMLITTKGWFGGGGDLTPMLRDTPEAAADAATFHAGFRAACDRHGADYYERFREWCDRYFYLPHRGEMRGVGGIFFDHHAPGAWEEDFGFVRDVGLAFLETYPAIVARRWAMPYGEAERERQLRQRGRYVEFNLLYDRGTLFGLRTGGNIEAILMSLPPEARWP